MTDNVTELAQAVRQLLMNTPDSPTLAASLERVREALKPIERTPPRIKCVRVEYDLNFWCGDYSGVGQFAYIPLDAISRLRGKNDDKRLRTAFTVLVGNPEHIIHYTFDEPVDQDGNEWKEWMKGNYYVPA